MPLYEYQCSACGHRVDRLQKSIDPPPVCDACDGASVMRKLISRSSFRLNGTGWARDGYGG